jgi:ribosomal protein S12 methylthiotransferase
MKISMVMLGCPKNDVDAEAMLFLLRKAGHETVMDPSEADAIIVNTCGFIEDAKRESVDTLLEMAKYKKAGKCKLLAATGCLPQRYKRELLDAMPEVDLMVGVNDTGKIAEILDGAIKDGQSPRSLRSLHCADAPVPPVIPGRILTSPASYAYLKIAEGCSNRCAYCAIPDIRGPYRSRPEADILREAEWLAEQGVYELILVAQDTTRWQASPVSNVLGHDLPGLLKKIVRIQGLGRVRVLYCYPELITDELLELVSGEEKVCNYIDVPLQHIDDGLLRRMNRRSGEAQIRDLIGKIRAKYDIALRTTFITGFPGEGDAEFEKLLGFVREARFDHLGVFAYSPEEGTPAYAMKPRVPAGTAKRRRHGIMAAQQRISAEILRGKTGRTYEVVADGFSEDGDLVCRSCEQAPDIDGAILVEGGCAEPGGKPFNVRITGSSEYDMRGERI